MRTGFSTFSAKAPLTASDQCSGAREEVGWLESASPSQDWLGFVASSDAWLNVESSEGRDAVERVYQQVLGGSADPSAGLLLKL